MLPEYMLHYLGTETPNMDVVLLLGILKTFTTCLLIVQVVIIPFLLADILVRWLAFLWWN